MSTTYEDLPFDELRHLAFERAKDRHDLKFFVGLFGHMPAAVSMADEGGSLGDIGGSITASIEAAHQMLSGEGAGELEPLLRGVFATYLRENPE